MKSLLVCLVGLLVSVQANPVSPPMVSGQVRLADGSPVAGARVVLFDLADLHRGPVSYALTDAAGQFALRGTAQGPRPHGVGLGQNYPNPFNPATVIPYQLAAPSRVRLEVFNVLGQPVATLVEGEQAAGEHVARWDGTDGAGRPAASGLYFYRLTVGGMQETRRMVLVDGQVGVPRVGSGVEAGSLSAALGSGYGLVVSGAGLATYVDADFGVTSGPVTIEVAAQPQGRAKVAPTLEEEDGAVAALLSGVLGDVDNNGAVDLADGLLVAMHRVQPGLSIPNQGVIGLGDVDCSGQIEERDAELLATWVVNPAAAAVASLSIGQRGGYSLDPVTEVVWGSILGTENQDATVARLLNEVPVLLSGIMEVDGKEHLYLGIGRAYHEQHGSKHIYTALKKRFPVTPLFVEPSDGVQLQSEQRSRGEAPPVQPAGEPITFTESPNAPIEDDTKQQTVGTITVPDDVTVGIVSVGVDITHPSRGDLTLDLVAPSGVATRIYNGFGEGVDTAANLVEVLPATSALRGQAAQGTWYLRASDHDADDEGILKAWELTITPMSAEAEQEEPEGVLFADTFTDGLGAWTTDATLSENPGWAARPFEGDESEDIVAQTWDCPLLCNLTTTQPLDLSGYRSVTLSFDRWIDRDIGEGEGLRVLIGNHGVYQPLEWWQAGDSHWQRETFTLTATQLSDAVTLRFVGIPTREFNKALKPLAIDNVVITEDAPNLTVSTISAWPTEPVSGASLSLNTTVENTGSALAPPATVRFYRHTAETATPTSGGTLLSETGDTGTLALGAGVSIAVADTAPTVAEPTQYHYYACLEDTCVEIPATVIVQPEQQEPEPTEAVTTDITHPTRSDLTVDLVAPSGATTRIYNGNNEGVDTTDNLTETKTTYALRGQQTKGTWYLQVSDHEEEDEGTLNAWSLTLAPTEATGQQQNEETIFEDDFTNGLQNWTPSALLSNNPGWEARALDETGDIVAQTHDCPILCNLTTTEQLDLSNYEKVTISYDYWIDRNVANGEGLTLHVGSNGIYKQTKQYTTGNSTWKTETITIENPSENTTIRFTAIPSSVFNKNPKKIAVDNVKITKGGKQEPEPTEPEPTETPTITVQTITATPTETTSRSPLSLAATVHNTTSTTAPSETIYFYRHENRTANPRTGGTRLSQRTTTGTLAPNETTTQTVTRMVRTVIETTIYHYYACTDNDCAGPATVTIQPKQDEPEPTEPQTDNTFTLSKVNASRNTVNSEETFSLTTTVTNTGNTTTNTTTVNFYRHTNATANPTTGGTKIVQTATIPALQKNEATQAAITTTAPATAGIYRYYACIEDTCATTPATIQVQPKEDTPAPTEDEQTLAIQSITATPMTVASGGNLSLTTTVQNTGTTSTQPTTIRFYQHTNQTTNPTVGGMRIVQTATTGTLAPNATTTKTITTIAPTVTNTTGYHYYACIGNTCTATPATIQVQATNGTPVIPIGTDTITRISASPYEPESETPIIVRFTIKNNDIEAKDVTVRVYQHRSRAINPTSGTLAGEVTIDSHAPSMSVTESITVTMPSATTATPLFYYVCVDTTCAGPATVTVYPRVAVPEPPYENCINLPIRKTPLGGDSLFAQEIRGGNVFFGFFGCGTITLGGLETTGGVRGLVTAGHNLDPRGSTTLFTNTDIFVGHSVTIKYFLGKTFRTSSQRTESDGRILILEADAAFIAYPYPYTQGCSLTWRNRDNERFCFELGHGDHVVERVSPLTIRGKGDDIYTVVGSRQPTPGLRINISGASSRVGEEGEVRNKVLVVESPGSGLYLYVYVTTKNDTIPGDSGAPVYTIPDTNGTTHIVGVHGGKIREGSVFSSWDDVVKALDLKPIAP